MRPAALDVTEGVGTHAGSLSAFRGQARLDQFGEPVTERARSRKLHVAVSIDLAAIVLLVMLFVLMYVVVGPLINILQ